MTEAEPVSAPAGVRPAGSGQLQWVDAGSFTLAIGDRVAVLDGDQEWSGEVLVPSDSIREWPVLCGLPSVVRRLRPDEWPAGPVREGQRLHDVLPIQPAAESSA